MYPHRIRLRGPWEYETAGAAPARGKLPLPGPLAGTPLASHPGPVRLSRRFGYPGRIDPDERVWLLIEGLSVPATVELNGADLGQAGSDGFDVTARLLPRNEVAVTLTVEPGQAPPWEEVCLEVRRTAYLRDVRVWVENDQTVHASGVVVGCAAGPVELYVVADRSPAAYTSLTPLERGQPFHLCGAVAGPVAEVKVELVQGAVVWYTAHHLLAPRTGA
jgi:hypothetical protein